jgi:hypothetical protein
MFDTSINITQLLKLFLSSLNSERLKHGFKNPLVRHVKRLYSKYRDLAAELNFLKSKSWIRRIVLARTIDSLQSKLNGIKEQLVSWVFSSVGVLK